MASLLSLASRSALSRHLGRAELCGFGRLLSSLRRTPLYDLHVEANASTTEFGGWEMPLLYKGKDAGILKEHLHCRSAAGLFDVSHMVPVRIEGADRVAFMETILPADVTSLAEGTSSLAVIPNAQGGLIDDCIVTNAGDHIYLVINAGHENIDLVHMDKHLQSFSGDARIEPMLGCGLLALQGPKAASVLERLAPGCDLNSFSFMTGRNLVVAGVDCYVTRSGYTGEDGFEMRSEGADASRLAMALLGEDEVRWIGLGARDSLRLEAGLCLYGNDLNETTTPSEAGLLWTIPKRRRQEGGFVGADVICAQISDKSRVKRKRAGFKATGPPPRAHDKIYTLDGEEIGEITSGVFGPSVGGPVAMGYVAKKYAKVGTELQVEVRGKMRPLTAAKMPFVPAGFFRG